MESTRLSRHTLPALFLAALFGVLLPATAQATQPIEIAGLKADEVIRGGLTVEVLAQPKMHRVVFRVGDYERSESHAPYSLAGDSRDKLFELDTELHLKDGPNTLVATVHWHDGTQTEGSIDFVVANNSWVGEEDDTLPLPVYSVAAPEEEGEQAPAAPAGPLSVSGLDEVVSGQVYVDVRSTEPVQSVRLVVPGVLDRTERSAPFALMGDVFGRLLPWDTTKVADGEYELQVTATMADGREETLVRPFAVLNNGAPSAPGDTGRVLVVGLPQVASGNVYAHVHVTEPATSVTMEIPGLIDRAERSAPYALAGDVFGLLNPWDTTRLPDGEYELRITVDFEQTGKEQFTYPFKIDNAPAPVATPPALADGKRPTPPKPDHIIRLGKGRHDLRDKIERWGVTLVTGDRDAVVTKIGYIPGASIILEGVTVETGAYKLVEGDGTGEAWLIDVDFSGRKFDPRRPNNELTWAPTWQFRKAVYINSTFRQVLRGNRGYTEIYDCTYEDVYEDLFQGSGVIRNVKARRIGTPHQKPGAHTDIIQAFGPVDVDGLEVDQYKHQGINLQHAAAGGSKFRNIRLRGHEGHGSGVLLETTHGNGGPSNITFENVKIDEVFRVRGINMLGHEYKNWEGRNVLVRNAEFPGKLPQDSRIRVENAVGGFTSVAASGSGAPVSAQATAPGAVSVVDAIPVAVGAESPEAAGGVEGEGEGEGEAEAPGVAEAVGPAGVSMADVPAVLADLNLSQGQMTQVVGPVVIRQDNAVLANMRIVLPASLDRYDYALRIDAANVVIHNVEIVGPGVNLGRGVVFTAESSDARVSQMLVQGFHSGVLLRGTGHQFERCVFTGMNGRGTGQLPVSVYGDRAEGVSFKHCVFNDLGRGGVRDEAGPHIELFKPWEATRDTTRQLEDHAMGVRFTACVVADGKAGAFQFGTGGSFVDGIIGPHSEPSFAAPPGGNITGNVVFHRDGSIASGPWFYWHSSIGDTLGAPLYDFEDQDWADLTLQPASGWDSDWVRTLLLTDRSELGQRIDAARAAHDARP